MFHISKNSYIDSEVRLTPATVDGEVDILQQLSGMDEEKHCLESCDYWGMCMSDTCH